MARLTRLYQSPRSPLIQGRTRYERPLWQAWVGGCLLGAAVLTGWYAVVSAAGIPAWFIAGLGWLAFAVVVGSGLGTIVANAFNWRLRWVAAGLVSVAGVAVAGAVLSTLSGK